MCAALRSPIRLVTGVMALLLLAVNCRPAEPLSVETPTATLEPTATLTPIPSTATPAPEPKTLTACIAEPAPPLLPYVQTSLAGRTIMQAIYDGPIDRLRDGYHPVILEKLPRLEDGNAQITEAAVKAGDTIVNEDGEIVTYEGPDTTLPQIVATFRLKPDLRWSDGEPLTAHDSVFTYESITDPDVLKDSALAFSLPRDVMDRTASYRALDDLTVEWVGLPGYLDREYFTRFFTPIPKHKLAGRDPVEFLGNADTLPVGWGPYRLVRWQPGDRMILERNPFYFRASEGLPRLDRVVFRFSGFEVIDAQGNVDDSSVVAAVAAGACDVVSIDPGTNLSLDVWQARAPDVQVYRTPWGVEYLFFNLDRLAGDPRPDFFGDRRVRLAFAHCIDRVGLGISAAALPADELPWTLSSDKAIVYTYDPARGRALLAEAGWADANGDGVADKGGVLFEVTLLTTTSPARRESAERIRDDMAACGVRIKLEFLEPGKLFAEGPDSPLYGRQFDLAEFAWLANDLSVCQTWRSDRIPSDAVGFAGSYQNFSGYRNPDFDAACLAYLRGVYEADREKVGQDLIALFAQDLPSLPLFWREWHTGTRAEVIGFGLDPFAAELWNIEEIDVQP